MFYYFCFLPLVLLAKMCWGIVLVVKLRLFMIEYQYKIYARKVAVQH